MPVLAIIRIFVIINRPKFMASPLLATAARVDYFPAPSYLPLLINLVHPYSEATLLSLLSRVQRSSNQRLSRFWVNELSYYFSHGS